VARELFAVSVAIPAFNEAARVGKAIESIRRQTEPPVEIIVVDDGSTDATADVAAALGAHVVRQKNAGVSAARNRAINEAKTPWIAFCDADDVWFPQKLARTRAAHELRPEVDFLFADHRSEYRGKITLLSMFATAPQYRANVTERVADGVDFFERSALIRGLARANFIAPSTVVVRRELLLEQRVYFDPDLPSSPQCHVSEDIEWYLRLLKFTDGLAVDCVLIEYHRHHGSLSDNVRRIQDGVLKLGDIVAAAPDRYAPGAAAACASERRTHLRAAAIAYARGLQFRDARPRLREAQGLEFRPGDEVLIALCTAAGLPGGVWAADALRHAWRHALKPALRLLPRRR